VGRLDPLIDSDGESFRIDERGEVDGDERYDLALTDPPFLDR
jgi:hypothetical protein